MGRLREIMLHLAKQVRHEFYKDRKFILGCRSAFPSASLIGVLVREIRASRAGRSAEKECYCMRRDVIRSWTPHCASHGYAA